MERIYAERPAPTDSEAEKEPRPTKLQQDVSHRWNSTYLMLETIILCQDGIRIGINR